MSVRHAVLASVTAAVAASVDAFAALLPVPIADARHRVRLPSLPAAGDVTLVNHGARPLAPVGAASLSAAPA